MISFSRHLFEYFIPTGIFANDLNFKYFHWKYIYIYECMQIISDNLLHLLKFAIVEMKIFEHLKS